MPVSVSFLLIKYQKFKNYLPHWVEEDNNRQIKGEAIATEEEMTRTVARLWTSPSLLPKNWCFWTVAVLSIHWKDWCWSWNSNTLATWCEELTHWRRPWWWEGLGAGGEVDNRGRDGWMASLTQWAWVWVNSGSWRWTGSPGVLQSMGLQRVGRDWVTKFNWSLLLGVSAELDESCCH